PADGEEDRDAQLSERLLRDRRERLGAVGQGKAVGDQHHHGGDEAQGVEVVLARADPPGQGHETAGSGGGPVGSSSKNWKRRNIPASRCERRVASRNARWAGREGGPIRSQTASQRIRRGVWLTSAPKSGRANSKTCA